MSSSKSELILQITDLARGGAGVARDRAEGSPKDFALRDSQKQKGRVIFVPFSAPGDRVRVRILREDRRYAQAELLEVLEPGPSRQTPPCPVFGRCGGCQWQHIPYSVQWETKSRGVVHALERLKIPPPKDVELLPAEQIWNYRNRIQLRGEEGEIGFFASQSHARVPIEQCWVARPEINAVIAETREEGRKLAAPYKVEIEVREDGSIHKSWNSRHAAAGFRQVHDGQNAKLRDWVASAVTRGGRVLDLFGGTGNLATAIMDFSESVDCVDVSAPDLPDSGDARSPRLRFHRSPVLKWLRQRTTQRTTQKTTQKTTMTSSVSPAPAFSSAILDPPREGLGEDFDETATALEKLGVREIVAVGCDPDSWARDVSRFLRRGWVLQRVAVLDLFPQTPHVEALGLLIRDLPAPSV